MKIRIDIAGQKILGISSKPNTTYEELLEIFNGAWLDMPFPPAVNTTVSLSKDHHWIVGKVKELRLCYDFKDNKLFTGSEKCDNYMYVVKLDELKLME